MSSPRTLDLSDPRMALRVVTGYTREDHQFLQQSFPKWDWQNVNFKDNQEHRKLLIWGLLSNENQTFATFKLDYNNLQLDDDFVDPMEHNRPAQLQSALKSLSLVGNQFTPKGFRNLLRAVNRSNVEELIIKKCNLSNEMIFILAEALEENYTLQRLDLSGSPKIDDPEALQVLAMALTKADAMVEVTLQFTIPQFASHPDFFNDELQDAFERIAALHVFKKMQQQTTVDRPNFEFIIQSTHFQYFLSERNRHIISLRANLKRMINLIDNFAYEFECKKFVDGESKTAPTLYQYEWSRHEAQHQLSSCPLIHFARPKTITSIKPEEQNISGKEFKPSPP